MSLKELRKLTHIEFPVRAKATHTLAQTFADSAPKYDQYALQRLVKGLMSSGSRSRQGFATALTTVLRSSPQISTRDVLACMEDEIKEIDGTRMEKKEVELGRIFFILALIKSQRISDVPLKRILEFVKFLFVEKMNWDSELRYETLCQLIPEVDFPVYLLHIWPLFETVLSQEISSWQPEFIALGLTLASFHKRNGSKLSINAVNNLLSRKQLAQLIPPLQKTVRSHPRIHFVWRHIFNQLLDEFNQSGKVKKLKSFWNGVLEGALFSTTGNDGKFLGLRLFSLVLSRLGEVVSKSGDVQKIEFLFSPNVVTCLKSRMAKGSLLHEICGATFDEITETCRKYPVVTVRVLAALHTFRDEKAPQRSLVVRLKKVIDMLTTDGWGDWTLYLIQQFHEHDSKSDDEDMANRAILTCIRESVRGLQSKTSAPIFLLLKFLVIHGFFSPLDQEKISQKEKSESGWRCNICDADNDNNAAKCQRCHIQASGFEVSEKTQQFCQTCFHGIVEQLQSVHPIRTVVDNLSKLKFSEQSPETAFYWNLLFFKRLEKLGFVLNTSLDEIAVEAREVVHELLRLVSDPESCLPKGLRVSIVGLASHLYYRILSDQESDAADTILQIAEFCKNAISEKPNEEEKEQSQTELVEAIIECILDELEETKFHAVCHQIVIGLADLVSKPSLVSMVRIVCQEESSAMDESESDDEFAPIDSDDIVMKDSDAPGEGDGSAPGDGNGSKDADLKDSKDSDEDSDEESDGEGEGEAKIQTPGSPPAGLEDLMDVKPSEVTDTVYETALATAVKMQVDKNKVVEKQKGERILYQKRVLVAISDLFKEYFHQENDVHGTEMFGILSPLLKTIRRNRKKMEKEKGFGRQIEIFCHMVVKTKIRNDVEYGETEKLELREYIKDLVQFSKLKLSKDLLGLVNSGILWISRAYLGKMPSQIVELSEQQEYILSIYTDAFLHHLKKKDYYNNQFFMKFMNKLRPFTIHFIARVCQMCADMPPQFKQSFRILHCFELLDDGLKLYQFQDPLPETPRFVFESSFNSLLLDVFPSPKSDTDETNETEKIEGIAKVPSRAVIVIERLRSIYNRTKKIKTAKEIQQCISTCLIPTLSRMEKSELYQKHQLNSRISSFLKILHKDEAMNNSKSEQQPSDEPGKKKSKQKKLRLIN